MKRIHKEAQRVEMARKWSINGGQLKFYWERVIKVSYRLILPALGSDDCHQPQYEKID